MLFNITDINNVLAHMFSQQSLIFIGKKLTHQSKYISAWIKYLLCILNVFPCAGYDTHVQIWLRDTHQPTRAVQAGSGKHALHQKYWSDTI